MIVSVSSIICALAFYSVVLGLASWLRRKHPEILNHGGASILLGSAVVATFRLIVPIELPFSQLFRSWNIFGTIVRVLRTYPIMLLVIGTVWFGKAIVLICKDVIAVCKAYTASRKYKKVENECVERVRKVAEDLSIRTRIVVSPEVGIPYVEGIFRHTIYLPILDFPKQEIGFILLHERQHIRNLDSITKVFFKLFADVMWWNPCAYHFWEDLDHLLELRCDQKLKKHMTDEEWALYEEMLRGMNGVLTGQEVMSLIAVNELVRVSDKEFLEQRLDIIHGGAKKAPLRVRAGVYSVLLVLFAASYLVIVQPAGVPPVNSFEEEPEVYYYEDFDDHEIEERSNDVFIIKGSDGRYKLFINYEFSRYLSEEEVASDQYRYLPIFEEGKQR